MSRSARVQICSGGWSRMSFGFAGGDHIAVSVETRPEKGEAYSAIGGFFKQFEVIYILAEERDVLQLEVIDNGRGIGERRAAGSPALGILGMRERVGALGGEFQIVAVKGRGTALRVSVPVARRDATDA